MDPIQKKTIDKTGKTDNREREKTEFKNSDDNRGQDRLFSILESLLFASEKPLSLSSLKEIFKETSVGVQEIRKALYELKFIYEESGRGLSLEEVGGGWQLCTKTENREFVQKLFKSRPFRLSASALEVLSIIAYKQPVIKSEVDRVRGVESGHLIRSLMEKKLISFQGKSELPGKPSQYGTTSRFLETFRLKNLRELPDLEEMGQLLPEGIGDDQQEQKEERLEDIGKFSIQNNPKEQGEKELKAIGETLKNIKTTVDFKEIRGEEEAVDPEKT